MKLARTFCVLLYKKKYTNKYEKHFPKMSRDVGMEVPKTTETRCRDGSVQARQVIKRLHKQPHPYIFLFSHRMALMFPEFS